MWSLLLALLLLVELATPLYFLAMRAAARRSAPRSIRVGPKADVTIVVATYNEEATIERRLADLRRHWRPGVNVLVVDSGSTDATRRKVRAAQAADPAFPLVLVEEPERRGKVAALRTALRLASGQLVCLTDADCLWGAGALEAAVARFNDPRVGAVTGVQRLLPGEGVAHGAEAAYGRFYETLRLGESALDSTPVFRGELAVYRRRLLERVGIGDEAPLADDSELAAKVRRLGYRAVVEPAATFHEFAPPTLASRQRQKVRRGAGLVQVLARNLPVALRPWRYRWFSLACIGNLLVLVGGPVATALLALLVPALAWAWGGPLALLTLAGLGAGVWAWSRLRPASPATALVSLAQGHAALLAALPLAFRRTATWAPIREVRDQWRRYAG
ncbi:MAG TPA: glycosyltransferase [Candidatus Thermoplasmatota archaeon]|nr:glycosyltransferase [Candidatus Thermoplasmatota archaeon]